MKNLMSVVLLTSALTSTAFAEKIVCIGETRMGTKAQVEIADNAVTVSGGSLSAPRVFKNLARANGLITARGLAVSFQNHYGCIRRATIITEFTDLIDAGYMEVMKVGACTGGSTPDSICGF